MKLTEKSARPKFALALVFGAGLFWASLFYALAHPNYAAICWYVASFALVLCVVGLIGWGWWAVRKTITAASDLWRESKLLAFVTLVLVALVGYKWWDVVTHRQFGHIEPAVDWLLLILGWLLLLSIIPRLALALGRLLKSEMGGPD